MEGKLFVFDCGISILDHIRQGLSIIFRWTNPSIQFWVTLAICSCISMWCFSCLCFGIQPFQQIPTISCECYLRKLSVRKHFGSRGRRRYCSTCCTRTHRPSLICLRTWQKELSAGFISLKCKVFFQIFQKFTAYSLCNLENNTKVLWFAVGYCANMFHLDAFFRKWVPIMQWKCISERQNWLVCFSKYTWTNIPSPKIVRHTAFAFIPCFCP